MQAGSGLPEEADMNCLSIFSLRCAVVMTFSGVLSPAVCWSDEKSGQLLYEAHCIACHNEQVHWRQNRLVKDWTTLRSQVERWRTNIGQRWSPQQVSDVAKYLNQEFYKFGPMDEARLKQSPGPIATEAALKR
jgi:hypothetical protein